MSRIVEIVNPVVLIALIVGAILGVFLMIFAVRVAWERNAYGLRQRWGRRKRRKHRQPPAYEALQPHDAAPSDSPKHPS